MIKAGITKSQLVIEVICFLLIVLFFYAAVTKLLDYEKFVAQLGQSLVLRGGAKFIAVILPAIEVLICIGLAIPRFKLYALYASMFLLFVFTVYIAVMLIVSSKLPCSCGGVLNTLSWSEHLVFNIIFLVAAGVSVWFSIRNKKTRSDQLR